ncbi:MAG TPA: hypothetical protein VJZ49_14745 [Syntrophales bacterium]|nr:hypothetical protein [Syntrophales bacterium]
MGVRVLNDLKEKAAGLTPEENLELIAHLLSNVRITPKVLVKKRRWREIYGKAHYPLTGEDAQTWVTRTRKESDERREKQWK